jgi:hypothetical protein
MAMSAEIRLSDVDGTAHAGRGADHGLRHAPREPRWRRLHAERVLGSEPAQVYTFLARLSNHGRLGDRHMRLAALDIDAKSARIDLRGPLGLRRSAHTVVTHQNPTMSWGGVAALGSRTRATVLWQIEPDVSGTRVVLSADVATAALLDRLQLELGGRWWLRRRFRSTLARLAAAMEHECDDSLYRMAAC